MMSGMETSRELRRLVLGYQVSQAIHVAAVLGLSDLLANGPLSAGELAVATDCDPRSLHRLLRALATVGVYEELPDGRYASTALGDELRSDSDDSIRGWAASIGRPYVWEAWSALLHSVRTGENAFRSVHGRSVWAYRADHPEDSAAFDAAMASISRRMASSIIDAYDFGRFSIVVDVGGGTGTLLSAILGRNPSLHGVLFDQPHVASAATRLMQRAGVSSRCRIVGGDMFHAIPPDGDCYLLKSIIHDWEDAEALAILKSCARAMDNTATLVMVERLLDGGSGQDVAFSDLNMLPDQ